jgi:hypothetical protein
MPRVLSELLRVLRPGGLLLVAFHAGDKTIHLDEWWGHKVCIDTFFFSAAEMTEFLRGAGFEIEQVTERPPYAGVEYPSQRAYILAKRSVS